MARHSTPTTTTQPIADRTLVLDNGAYTMKAGYATSSPPDPQRDCKVIPNCVARTNDNQLWIGSQLDDCRDFGKILFRRPVDRGYLVNWEAEKEIWECSFFNEDATVQCDPHETNLILTEAPNSPQTLQTNCDEMVFEEFEFACYYRCIGPSLNAFNDIKSLCETSSGIWNTPVVPAEAALVVDSGYSHTTVTPLIRGRPVQGAIRRLDIGGKLMTNHLCELVSAHQYNMLDEIYLMNEIKEAVCFVTNDFRTDLKRSWRGGSKALDPDIVVNYVLPDYDKRTHGFVRPFDSSSVYSSATKKRRLVGGGGTTSPGDSGVNSAVPEEVMMLANERFTVPELLFHPEDIGLQQAGLPETIMQSLAALPGGLWPAMLANVILIGGNAQLPGLVERLEMELRCLIPSECLFLRILKPSDPIKYTWLGGVHLANDHRPTLQSVLVTRQQYSEYGGPWLLKRFGKGLGVDGHSHGHGGDGHGDGYHGRSAFDTLTISGTSTSGDTSDDDEINDGDGGSSQSSSL